MRYNRYDLLADVVIYSLSFLAILLILSSVCGAPPQVPMPPQAPTVRHITPDEPVKPIKVCPCSPECVCGCNEGLPCTCGEAKVVPTTTSIHYTSHIRSVPIPVMQPVVPSHSVHPAPVIRGIPAISLPYQSRIVTPLTRSGGC